MNTLRCSFCKQSLDDITQLIVGPDVSICDECVDICREIVEEKRHWVLERLNMMDMYR